MLWPARDASFAAFDINFLLQMWHMKICQQQTRTGRKQTFILTLNLSLASCNALRLSLNLFSSFHVFIKQILIQHLPGSRHFAPYWKYDSVGGWDLWEADLKWRFVFKRVTRECFEDLHQWKGDDECRTGQRGKWAAAKSQWSHSQPHVQLEICLQRYPKLEQGDWAFTTPLLFSG